MRMTCSLLAALGGIQGNLVSQGLRRILCVHDGRDADGDWLGWDAWVHPGN
jgi:hypothetical protein